MAITLETAARNAACDAIVDLIDGGTGPGYLKFETSGDVECATITFGATAFGAAAAGVATANSTTDDTSATGGTVAQFSIYADSDVKILEGTAGTSGTDITMSSASIIEGDTVSLDSLTITMPAS